MSEPSSIYLRLDAPFAAWRWLQAGVYRATFPVIPPSAAWGLALNLAAIDSRGELSEVVTPIRADAPALEIAVGVEQPGQSSSLYQQLHSYPVGGSGKAFREKTKGNKFWIAPIRREILVGLVAVIGARGPRELIRRIPQGLAGELDVARYGLPFAGDNQLLFSRIDVLEASPVAHWYIPAEGVTRPRETARLTTNIDRDDSGRTQAPLFVPTDLQTCPGSAWTRIGPCSEAEAS